jgi:hypothetical protein
MNPSTVFNPDDLDSNTKAQLSEYPLFKLDTTKESSFKNLRITFDNEPPNATIGDSYEQVLIHQFAHGYDYIPLIWFIMKNPAVPTFVAPTSGQVKVQFKEFADDTAAAVSNLQSPSDFGVGGQIARAQYNDGVTTNTNLAAAYLIVGADDTNVYIWVAKDRVQNSYPLVTIEPNIIGTVLDLKIYTYVENML